MMRSSLAHAINTGIVSRGVRGKRTLIGFGRAEALPGLEESRRALVRAENDGLSVRCGLLRDEDAGVVFPEPRREARLAVDASPEVTLEQPDVDAGNEAAWVETSGIRQYQAAHA